MLLGYACFYSNHHKLTQSKHCAGSISAYKYWSVSGSVILYYNKTTKCSQAQGNTHNTQKVGETGVNRERQLVSALGPPCWLICFNQHQQKSSQNITQSTHFVFIVCSCIPATVLWLTHTFDLSLPLLYISSKYTCAAEQKANKHREVPELQHSKKHKHQHRCTLFDDVCTQYTWSQV